MSQYRFSKVKLQINPTDGKVRTVQNYSRTGTEKLSGLLRVKNKIQLISDQILSDPTPLQSSATHSYRRRNIGEPLRWYLLLDALVLAAAFFIAWISATFLNHQLFNRPLYKEGTHDAWVRMLQYIMISGGVLLNLDRKGHYRLRMPFWLEARSIVATLGLALVVDGFLQFAGKQDFSRMCLVLSWALASFMMIGAHNTLRFFFLRHNIWQVRTLIVGKGATVQDARSAIKSEPSLGYVITAFINDLNEISENEEESWENICAHHKVDYILLALDGDELVHVEKFIEKLIRENIPFSIVPPLRHLPVFGMVPHYFFNHDVMLLTHNQGLEQLLPRVIKRSFDIIMAGLVVALLSPLMLIIAIIVKRDGGPVLFGHRRIGLNGEVFNCLKFRTMSVDSDKLLKRYLSMHAEARMEWMRERKLRNDPRVTSFGQFLRRSSLDELPQLINVLFGHMSLVGPRPIVHDETEKYNEDIAYYYRVRPGITGLWQVSGRNDVSYGKRVHMDIWYVRNWSLWHDIAIICKTFPVILSRAGAY